MFVYGKCGDKCQILFCQFYLEDQIVWTCNALLFLEQNCGTIFSMIRDIEVRNSIAKNFFLVLSIPVKSGWSFYTKKVQRRGVLWSILTNVNCCVNSRSDCFGLQMHCFWSQIRTNFDVVKIEKLHCRHTFGFFDSIEIRKKLMYMRKHKEGLVYPSFISFHIICFISVAVHMNKFRSFHLARNISGIKFACTLEILCISWNYKEHHANCRCTQICCCRYNWETWAQATVMSCG